MKANFDDTTMFQEEKFRRKKCKGFGTSYTPSKFDVVYARLVLNIAECNDEVSPRLVLSDVECKI